MYVSTRFAVTEQGPRLACTQEDEMTKQQREDRAD
jgi:hypothetical protein